MMVNQWKSRAFISSHIPRCRQRRIQQLMGINFTSDLGHYLGVPLHRGRATCATLKYILDKLQSKLASWKSSLLSVEGRHILVQDTLTTVPLYTMQLQWVPTSIVML